MKRFVFLISFATCVTVLNGADTLACDCFVPSPPMLAGRLPHFAFSGQVMAIYHRPESKFSDVTFKVLNSWEYELRGKISIVSSRGGKCGFPFKVGKTYLVYAELVDRTASGMKICQRSLKLSGAGKELEMLNRGSRRRIQLLKLSSAVTRFRSVSARAGTVNLTQEDKTVTAQTR